VQHKGLGVKLLAEAERIANEEFHCDKIDILSGIGVREYYRSIGYQLAGAYMVKSLIP
jgi:elongator complex protein 3